MNDDPELVADATAYRALQELLRRCVEVTLYAEDGLGTMLCVVSPECAQRYVGHDIASALAEEFKASKGAAYCDAAGRSVVDVPANPSACRVCRGTGRDPMSDITNWFPCSACGGTGALHEDRRPQ